MSYQVNQIVKGINAGTFVILAFRTVGFDDGVQVKAVNPKDHTQTAGGEFFLPLDAIKPLS